MADDRFFERAFVVRDEQRAAAHQAYALAMAERQAGLAQEVNHKLVAHRLLNCGFRPSRADFPAITESFDCLSMMCIKGWHLSGTAITPVVISERSARERNQEAAENQRRFHEALRGLSMLVR